jgi:hypothetical protein
MREELIANPGAHEPSSNTLIALVRKMFHLASRCCSNVNSPAVLIESDVARGQACGIDDQHVDIAAWTCVAAGDATPQQDPADSSMLSRQAAHSSRNGNGEEIEIADGQLAIHAATS